MRNVFKIPSNSLNRYLSNSGHSLKAEEERKMPRPPGAFRNTQNLENSATTGDVSQHVREEGAAPWGNIMPSEVQVGN